MLLEWLGEHRGFSAGATVARAINEAVDETLADPAARTRDLGGPLGTKAFTQRVLARLG